MKKNVDKSNCIYGVPEHKMSYVYKKNEKKNMKIVTYAKDFKHQKSNYKFKLSHISSQIKGLY